MTATARMLRCWLLPACATVLFMAPAMAQVSEQQRSANEAQQKKISNARVAEANRRQLTLFDASGKPAGTVGKPQDQRAAALSPDGSRIAVVRPDRQAESSDLFILDAASGAEVRMTTNKPLEGVGAPVWSPDGHEVAFIALRGSRYNIYRCKVDGPQRGELQLVYAHNGEPLMLGDWSMDGRYLVLSTRGGESAGRLYVADLKATGKPEVVAEIEGLVVSPRMSPDNRYISYLTLTEAGFAQFVTRAVPATSGKPKTWQVTREPAFTLGFWDPGGSVFRYVAKGRRLMSVAVDTRGEEFKVGEERVTATLPETLSDNADEVIDNLTLLGDGKKLLYNRAPAPVRQQIAVLDRKGRELVRLGQPAFYDQPSFSPDGKRLLVQTNDKNTQSYVAMDIAGSKTVQVTEPQSMYYYMAAAWMADGQHIAYSNLPGLPSLGKYGWVYRKRADGMGEAEPLYRGEEDVAVALSDVARDASYLLLDTYGYVQAVRLTGSDPLARPPLDVLRAEFEVSAPRLSPDGRTVAYLYNETGRGEVHIAPFDAAAGAVHDDQRVQISHDDAAGALQWRADGRELYYLSEMLDTPELNDFRMMAVSVTPGPVPKAGKPRELFHLTLPASITEPGIARAGTGSLPLWQNVDPDGQRFAFVVPARISP